MDAEPEAEESGPERRCIASGDRLPKERMVRFVIGPGNEVVPDVAATLPGRGLWLTARRDVVALAVKKRSFDRAARRSVRVPPDLADRVEGLLAGRCRDALGLARRAGKAVAGFEKVGQMLRGGQAGLVMAASDGADDGRRKIAGLAGELPIVAVLSAGELGAAFGRDHVVHAAIGLGSLADRLMVDGARLGGFRLTAPGPRGADKNRVRQGQADTDGADGV